MNNFKINLRVYYEDTDAGGVVYYANYLKFYERCRTEYLRKLGFEQNILLDEFGIVFVVKKVDIEYLKPALFNDELIIDLQVVKKTKISLVFEQTTVKALDKSIILNKALVTVVCVDKKLFKATKMPKEIANLL